MTTKKKIETIEAPVAIDLTTIAIALVTKTYDANRMSLRAGDRDYIQSNAEFTVGDLVVNTADSFFDKTCLDRVGTVLEIRDGEIEIRRLDGVTRSIIPAIGTYLAVKGAQSDDQP